jgi:hypothetical protein
MPDIKTALATALKEWEPPAEGTVIESAAPASKPAATTKRNLTRDTFAMVRDNPGILRANAIERLETMGHKPTSTTSILSQMVRAKMIDEVGHGILSTKRKHYTSLTNKLRKQDGVKGKVKAKPKDKPRVSKVAVPVGGGYYSTTEAAQAEWFNRTYPKDGEAALHPEATSTPQPLDSIQPQLLTMSLEEWLDTVPLKTARQVYWKLHGIFGGQAL